MLTFILASFFFFILITLFGYGLHWAIHQPWSGKLYNSHMVHHYLYTSEDFTSDIYRDPGKNNSAFIFAIAGLPLLLLPIGLFFFGKLGLFTTIFVLAEMLVVGLLNDRIHDSFHVNNHWLGFIPGYKKLVSLHLQHHRDMSKNYGIFYFFWDKVFKTFQDN